MPITNTVDDFQSLQEINGSYSLYGSYKKFTQLEDISIEQTLYRKNIQFLSLGVPTINECSVNVTRNILPPSPPRIAYLEYTFIGMYLVTNSVVTWITEDSNSLAPDGANAAEYDVFGLAKDPIRKYR